MKVWSLSLGLLLLSAPVFAKTVAEIMQSKELILGVTTMDYPPFVLTDSQGKIGGIDVELAQNLAESLGVRLKINREAQQYTDFPKLLNDGKVDFFANGTRRYVKRASEMLFSKPYLSEKRIFYPIWGTLTETLIRRWRESASAVS